MQKRLQPINTNHRVSRPDWKRLS